MSLSCSCSYDLGPGDICWESPSDFETLQAKRPRRCACCHASIMPGEVCLRFRRWKLTDIEIRIYGEGYDCGPARADHYLCESCGDQYYNLEDLGFCLDYAKVLEHLADYREMTKR